MGYTVFDIETIPKPMEVLESIIPPFNADDVKLGNLKDPAKIEAKIEEARLTHVDDFIESAALDARYSEVCAIGYRAFTTKNGEVTRIDGQADGRTEKEIVEQFWQTFLNIYGKDISLVGFNSHNFDQPYLMRRSWALGAMVPYGVMQKDRWWNEHFVDLRVRWQCGQQWTQSAAQVGGLTGLCNALGVPCRPKKSGKDFGKLWQSDVAAASDYLTADLDETEQCALRMGFSRPDGT